jgi:poly-gamma-glutamate synthesis protein (capsule biosynthesis protein)
VTATVILAVGDLILDEPDPDSFFEPSRALLTAADVAIGHVEVPHSSRGVVCTTDVPAPPADPAALGAVARAGFDVVTLAGNHMFDAGPDALADTIDGAVGAGLVTAGAGSDLATARRPGVVRTDGVSVAVLSYNCVGPRESWATSKKPGCAYLHVMTHYELDHASPGGPPRVYSFTDPAHVEWLADDVAAAREQADIVVVAMHKGIGHLPAVLAMYESPLARAAIDAGADAVVGHHAHILRGIEVYKGRPIFHGLGNFVTVTRALTPADAKSAEAAAWAARRRELFGFAPDPDLPWYPFHPESRNTIVARLEIDDGRLAAGFVPCWIDDEGRPCPLEGADADPVVDYVQDISEHAGFVLELGREAGAHVGIDLS